MEKFADSDLILQPHQMKWCDHNQTLEQNIQTWPNGFSDYTICLPLSHKEYTKCFVLSLLLLPFQLAESCVPFCISRLLMKRSLEDKVVLEDGVCLVLQCCCLKEHKVLLKDRVLQTPPEAHTRYLHVQVLLLAL